MICPLSRDSRRYGRPTGASRMRLQVRSWAPKHIDLRGRHPRVWRADVEAVHRLLMRERGRKR